MPLSPEEIHDRAGRAAGPDGRLPAPPVEEWDIFPFEARGDRIVVRPLQPPTRVDHPRAGVGGVDCFNCAGDGSAVRVWEDDLASDYGLVCSWLTRAMGALDHVGRVHVCRWGDGSEHLHVWFVARPERLAQVVGSLAVEWNEILPPPPLEVWERDLSAVAAAMAEHRGLARR